MEWRYPEPEVQREGSGLRQSWWTAARFGKMSTTLVRRLISSLRRSCGLFGQTCLSAGHGEGGEGENIRAHVGQ